MKYSFHNVILSCHYSATANSEDSTKFNSSSPKLAGWCLETLLILPNWIFVHKYIARTTQKIQPPYFWERMFTAPLHNDGHNSSVAFVFVAVGIYLPSRCLARNVYFDFTIAAFRRHITKCWVRAWLKCEMGTATIKYFAYLMRNETASISKWE
jgi:hypothetical protein